MASKSFSKIVSEAIVDLQEHGFDSIGRVERWQREITYAAEREAKSDETVDARLKEHLSRIFASQITNGRILRNHQIERWTLEKIKPKLRIALDRHIMASAQLIKLNRQEMINRTLSRFSGWATSLPVGGSLAVDKREVGENIKKSLKQLSFVERRVMIDQSHKLKASMDSIIATDGGAIAAEWTIRNTAGYENRPEHKARAGKIYLIRDSWAIKQGLVKLGGHEYTDEIDQPSEKIYCSCIFRYLYNLRSIPSECLTEKGRAALSK